MLYINNQVSGTNPGEPLVVWYRLYIQTGVQIRQTNFFLQEELYLMYRILVWFIQGLVQTEFSVHQLYLFLNKIHFKLILVVDTIIQHVYAFDTNLLKYKMQVLLKLARINGAKLALCKEMPCKIYTNKYVVRKCKITLFTQTLCI